MLFSNVYRLYFVKVLVTERFIYFQVNELSGVKESDTGLAPPALWDIAADKQAMQSEQPLQVMFFRCEKH